MPTIGPDICDLFYSMLSRRAFDSRASLTDSRDEAGTFLLKQDYVEKRASCSWYSYFCFWLYHSICYGI